MKTRSKSNELTSSTATIVDSPTFESLGIAVPPDNATLRMGATTPTWSIRKFTLTGADGAVLLRSSAARVQIGSHESNDVHLSDPTVSRFHCELASDGQRVTVRDLGSTNGTIVDGVRVMEAVLDHDARLSLGAVTLGFELMPGTDSVPVTSHNRFGQLVGNSVAQRSVFGVLEKAARSDATVLIQGETGTGKTRAAMALHQASARASKPFLVVDCGALPAALLEAELFGHEKGAFTGAVQRRVGVFEEAHGGTVLLDEVGELPLELQPKLLRLLEDRQVRRIGQNKWFPVDVRIVAATHRDLREAVNANRFRADLFFRLAVVRVTMPALREHAEDIPAIAEELLRALGATPRTHKTLFSPAFFDKLREGSWAGNARELRNYLERCVVLDGEPPPDTEVTVAPVGQSPSGALGALSEARERAVRAFERAYLVALLERHRGRVAEAATEAEVDRAYLYRLIRKHHVVFKDAEAAPSE